MPPMSNLPNTIRRRELMGRLASAPVTRHPLSDSNPLIMEYGASRHSAQIRCDTHDFCEIGIVTGGEYFFLDSKAKTSLTPGNFWCYGPWEPHGWTVPGKGARRIVILFLPSFLLKIMPDEGPLPYLPFIIPDLKKKIQPSTPKQRAANIRFAKDLLSEYSAHRKGWQTVIQLRLTIFFIKLLRNSGISSFGQNSKTGTQSLKVIHAVQYIRQFIREKLTIQRIAGHADISKRQLTIAFRELVGASVPEYITRCRIEGVRHTLLTSDEKLETIARYWGFANASHLCNNFKDRYKITPNDFRKNPKKSELIRNP